MDDKNLNELPAPLLRLLDANLNRLREGIRVIEDIRRYCFDDEINAKKLKALRHKARLEPYIALLKTRDIEGDILKSTTKSEALRENLESVQTANMKRAQESARVLEESLKLISQKDAQTFKELRYELYGIEKALAARE
ncbi:MAG: thiamine-phosphate pyrophosphorylase [Campylobacteraceae bacterium]|jgi:thiamine-phosphate pyrophosphorylase|nr:thiamine-phosphate pyrophosphorylase [Campylobacteraceae bacterium]